MSYNEKQEELRKVKKDMNDNMEDVMKNYDKVEKVDDDIAKIKAMYFVKNKGGKYAGQWRELYDNEIEEMNTLHKSGISDKEYLRYRQDNTYYDDEGKAHQKKSVEKIDYMLNKMNLSEKQLDAMYTETIGNEDKTYQKYKGSTKAYLRFKVDSDKQKKSRTSDKDASVNKTDKMNALIKGNYTNKERQQLYDTFVEDDDYTYQTLKKTNINMKEYLNYKQTKLESDKIDDGTVKGKTVKNSLKTKTMAYINNMNITYEQKLILMGDKYKLSTEERTKVYHYINSLDLTKEQKLQMYGNLTGFTVYKDGRVTW